MKKDNLISYWIKDFSKYIEYEESFVPHKLIRYKIFNTITDKEY